MSIEEKIRTVVKGRPWLRRLLLPGLWLVKLRWRFLAVVGLPVTYRAQGRTLRLHPVGQIARLLSVGNFESLERSFVEAYLNPGMSMVNVGANIGLYVILASSIVGPDGVVFAFEPSSETFDRLKRNLDLNGCRNAVLVRSAVSDEPAQLMLRNDPSNPALDGHRYVETLTNVGKRLPSDEIVESVILDDYLRSFGNGTPPRIDLMIIDVEGAEFSVLKGARATLARNDLTILLECSKNCIEVEQFLRELGYQFWNWDPQARRLVSADFQDLSRKQDVIVRRQGWEAGTRADQVADADGGLRRPAPWNRRAP